MIYKKGSKLKNLLSITTGVLLISLSACALIPDVPPEPTPTSPPPPSGYEPKASDQQLSRDPVDIDYSKTSLLVRESFPVQVSVELAGNLSDPCHQLRVVVSPPNEQREINLDVYSLYNPGLACIMVIKPFEVNIPLGAFSPGHYTVFINGQLLGEFDA
jgi:hypothetical protein